MTETRSYRGVDFTLFEVEELENKEINDVQLARDLESDCDVTISQTSLISSDKCGHRHNLGVEFTIFEAEGKLENNEIIHVELMRELDSD